MKKFLLIFAVLLLCFTLLAVHSGRAAFDPVVPDGSTPPTETASPVPTLPPVTTIPTEPEPTPEELVRDLMDQMSLREKVGQLFIVRPDALDFDGSSITENSGNADGTKYFTASMQQNLQNYPVGGVCIFHQNLVGPDQLDALLHDIDAASRIPLFLSVDEEGGTVARLAGHGGFDLPTYESASAVGAEGGRDGAYQMGFTIGSYLLDAGFNMDFAPVADVNTNPQNPVIGERAFSSDPQEAAVLAGACAAGLRDAGVVPVFKHFPGHGDTAQDSHTGTATVYKTMEELEACELIPFFQATDSDAVMVSHVSVPAVTGDDTPASLSPILVKDLLQDQMGFGGLVITDSLNMGAVKGRFPSDEAALAALNAGCHILLMPQDLQLAFDGVAAAVENGTFPAEQLDRTVFHILLFKLDHGILTLPE